MTVTPGRHARRFMARRSMARRLLLLALVASSPLRADETRPTEYEVKAAFLYNFTHFVAWPDSTAADTLRICILGDDPFGAALDAILDRTTGGRPVVVEHLASSEAAHHCHILFISLSEERRVGQILEAVASRPILTVSDIDGFAERGGIVGFVTRHNKIRFQLNAAAADRAQVRLSAKLLRLAERVGQESVP